MMWRKKNAIYSREQLEGIGAFLPLFEQPDFSAGKWSEVKKSASGVLFMPTFLPSEAFTAFVDAAYRLGWIRPDIDWPKWKGTSEAIELRDNEAALAKATPDQLAHLLTTLIRQERFCEGILAAAYDSGLLTGIVRRAAQLAAELAEGTSP